MRYVALVACAFAATWLSCLAPAVGQEPRLERLSGSDVTHLIVIRFSEELFEPIVDKEIQVAKRVNEVILGTPVHGHSRTRGNVDVDIRPNPRDASLVFTFRGQTTANTTGRKGPAVIHSHCVTNFVCSSRVVFDLENGFHAGPVVVRSNTNVTPVSVRALKPGLRGRLIRRIAWKRVLEQRGAANAESAVLARRDIVSGFERRLEQQLEQLNERVATTELVTVLLGGITDTDYSVTSTDKYIELAVRRQGTPRVPADIPEHEIADAAVEVWVHSSLLEPEVFNAFQTVATIREYAQPLLRAIVAARRSSGEQINFVRRIASWRIWDRPVFDGRLIQTITRNWATRPNRTLVGIDTTSDWLFFGINDVAVAERRARGERSTQPVSRRR